MCLLSQKWTESPADNNRHLSSCHQVEPGTHLSPGSCGRSKGGDSFTSRLVSDLNYLYYASQETNKKTGTQ